MKTTVVLAFPGAGKSYFAANNDSGLKIIDLDSHSYTLGHGKDGKVRSADFPDNYIKAIKDHLGRADLLFVSIHQEVRDALQREGTPFILVYPEDGLRAEYIERYRQRHTPQSFMSISVITDNWSAILEQLKNQKGCKHVVLKSGQFVSDIMSSSIPISPPRY